MFYWSRTGYNPPDKIPCSKPNEWQRSTGYMMVNEELLIHWQSLLKPNEWHPIAATQQDKRQIQDRGHRLFYRALLVSGRQKFSDSETKNYREKVFRPKNSRATNLHLSCTYPYQCVDKLCLSTESRKYTKKQTLIINNAKLVFVDVLTADQGCQHVACVQATSTEAIA